SSKVRAARSRAARSPNTVMSAPWSRCSAATHSSGPTPAGSPGTSARRGRVISAAVCAGTDPDVDVGLAAHLAQEALPFVFHLALADAFADGGAALFVVHFRLARGDPLDHVPAGLGAERLRYSAVLQRCQLGTELGAEIVGPEPAQVAAAGGAGGVLGGFGRNRGEVFARDDARAQRRGAGSGRVVPRRVLAGADEDVARVVLGLGTAAGGARIAHVHQLQQLEPAGSAHRAQHVAGLHGAHGGAERRRNLVGPAPAQVAAFQRVGAVGIADRRGGELHVPAVDQGLDAVDLFLGHLHLLRRGAVGERDQDVRQAVLAAAGNGAH